MQMAFWAAEESDLLQFELGVVALLCIAALIAILIRRIKLPYTVALVLAGLLLSFFPNFLGFTLSSDLILAILVPPLVFEATLQLNWRTLRANLWPVLLLAVVGTLVVTVIVGQIVRQVLDVPLAAAYAFGALISATDPVAVIAFFRSLGVSKRLSVLVEGESLLNDGVAIVLFNLALSLAGTAVSTQTISLGSAVLDFLRISLGGVGVGLVLGYIVSSIILKNLDDHLIETATTVALAFGAFVIAEEFHVSGILSVVAAGLMVGNIGTQNTSPTTKLTLDNFWEFLAFVVNSLVFLLLGLEINITQWGAYVVPILVAVLAVLLSRAVIVYLFTGIYNRLAPARKHISTAFQQVMFWGGLRGAISLALALTLSADMFGGTALGRQIAEELRVMTFGVVLFTLLVQGTTIERLIRHLGLAERPWPRQEQQRRLAQFYAKRAGRRELDRLYEEGILSRDIWEAMCAVYEVEIDTHKHALREHMHHYAELEQEMYLQAREDVLIAERSALVQAARHGFISEDIQHELTREADNHLAALNAIMENRGMGTQDGMGEK